MAAAQKSKRNHAHCKSRTAKILLRRVECSSFVLRTSASTWSQCPNGVTKTRMPCSLVGNDWSPLHTTGGIALHPASTMCSQPTENTPARFHICVFPWLIRIRAWSHKAVCTCLCRMAKRSGAATMKMSPKKARLLGGLHALMQSSGPCAKKPRLLAGDPPCVVVGASSLANFFHGKSHCRHKRAFQELWLSS